MATGVAVPGPFCPMGLITHGLLLSLSGLLPDWALLLPKFVIMILIICCTFPSDKLYVIGGFDGENCLDSTEMYSPFTNQWTLLTPMSCARSGVSLIAYKDYLYALGGFDGENRLQTGTS